MSSLGMQGPKGYVLVIEEAHLDSSSLFPDTKLSYVLTHNFFLFVWRIYFFFCGGGGLSLIPVKERERVFGKVSNVCVNCIVEFARYK